jgi:hypothetical protein
MSQQHIPQLDYGIQPRRRRWWSGVLVILVLVASVAVVQWIGRPTFDAVRRTNLARAFYDQASRFEAPPSAMVYGQNEDLEHLLRDDPWFGQSARHGSGTIIGSFQRGGNSFHSVRLRELGALDYDRANEGGSTLFIGLRTTDSGDTRLVHLMLHLPRLGDLLHLLRGEKRPELEATWHSIDRPGRWRQPAPVMGHAKLGEWVHIDQKRTRFYFGAADPADASRFSIRYEVGNDEEGFAEGFIDGKLEDDLTVTLTVRDGPLRE